MTGSTTITDLSHCTDLGCEPLDEDSKSNGKRYKKDSFTIGQGKPPHQPVDDGGKLIVGISQILDNRKEGGKERSAYYAAEKKHQQPVSTIKSGYTKGKQNGQEAEQKGAPLYHQPVIGDDHPQSSAE